MLMIRVILMLVITIGCFVHFGYGQNDFGDVRRDATRQMSAGRYGEAIRVLTEYIAENPSRAEAYYLRALCYENRSQLEKAVEDLRKADELDPANTQTRESLDRVQLALTTKVETRIEGYKRELARNPSSPSSYLDIAKAYVLLQDWDKAEEWYDQYLQRTTAPPEEVLRYAELLGQRNQLTKGETLLRQYVREYPAQSELATKHGYFLLWLGNYSEAEKTFERVLASDPSNPDARDGLRQTQSRRKATSSRAVSPGASDPQRQFESPVDRSMRLLRENPKDEELRFRLAWQLAEVERFEEAYRQLDTLLLGFADSIRVRESRKAITVKRDSVVRGKIAQYESILQEEPANRLAALRLAEQYGILGEYRTGVMYLDRYLQGTSPEQSRDIGFLYAQYAAWGGMYDTSLATVDLLLKAEPGNLEYQLLRGQLTVWMASDLDEGLRYLNNVIRRNPSNLIALVTASSALALKGDYAGAQDMIRQAKNIAPASPEVHSAEAFLAEALRLDRERRTFAVLTQARETVAAGECEQALASYQNYFSLIEAPARSVVLEYADAQSCAKHLDIAVSIYDSLLREVYDHDIAVLRAKNLLWSGDSLGAIQEFTRLTRERPDDFVAMLYLGDSYGNVRQYSRARDIYEGLLSGSATDENRELVQDRLRLLPPTGLSGVLATFPTRVAVSPPAFLYTDNQDFSLANYGGRLEIGVLNSLSLGAFFQQSQLRSSVSTRYLNSVKGQAFVRFSDRFSANLAVGTLSSPGKRTRTVGDASLIYEKTNTVRFSAYYEYSDAAVVLYSPYLIDLEYMAQLLSFSGWYETRSRIVLSGTLKSVWISDGNTGNELYLRIGPEIFDQFVAGYEYGYTDYTEQAPDVPFTDRTRQIYYSPQNLESHCLWVEWTPQQDDEVTFNLRGKIGYLPSFKARVRELGGNLSYHPLPQLVLTAGVVVGSNIRFDSNYNYASLSFSAYIRLH